MPNQLTSLRFPDLGTLNKFTCDGKNELKPLSLVNIFIGQNNSGKSLLLRQLFSNIKLDYLTSEWNQDMFNNQSLFKAFRDLFGENFKTIGDVNYNALDKVIAKIEKYISYH